MTLGHELTTLELAKQIADSVLVAALERMAGAGVDVGPVSLLLVRVDPLHADPLTQAVLLTLDATGSWFTRTPTEHAADDVRYEQIDLFDDPPPPGDRAGTHAETKWRDKHEG